MNIDKAIEEIRLIKHSGAKILIGIDGLGGAGKTTFADKLAQRLRDTKIVHIDDFYKPEGERTLEITGSVSQDFDWEKLQTDVLDNLVDISEGKKNVIVEGIYSTQDRFRDYYDYTIWISAKREQRMANTIAREGSHLAKEWQEKWMPKEDAYWETRPDRKVNLNIS